MTSNELGVLNSINEKLKYGDIQKIAELADLTRERTGFCLNPKNDAYNEVVVEKALVVIEEREAKTSGQLKKLNSL